jgi:hypothetical protein
VMVRISRGSGKTSNHHKLSQAKRLQKNKNREAMQ